MVRFLMPFNYFVQVLLAILDVVDDTKLVTKVCVYVFRKSCTLCYIVISFSVAIVVIDQ